MTQNMFHPLRPLALAAVAGLLAASCSLMPSASGGRPVSDGSTRTTAGGPDGAPGQAAPPVATGFAPGSVPRLASGWILAIGSLNEPEIWTAAQQLGATRFILIGQADGETKGAYDEAKLRRAIGERVPAGYRGLAQLDFEGRWIAYLNAPEDSPTFREGEAALLRLLTVARQVRPEAQWSIYGLPSVPFWLPLQGQPTRSWFDATPEAQAPARAKARRAQAVIDACDWVAPSVYVPYLPSRDDPKVLAVQAGYARAKTAIAVELAKGKPVLPMTWHRVHDSNKVDGGKRLTPDEMIEGQIKPAIEAGAAGVVWWGSDGMLVRTVGRDVPRPPDVPPSAYNDADAMRRWVVREHVRMLNELAADMNRIRRSP
ncbi:MAG: hypothetical protein KDA22_01510 [Phycisphaerales bacterium]|nr:hypothetical protein [Phycisphaerales bacterium]